MPAPVIAAIIVVAVLALASVVYLTGRDPVHPPDAEPCAHILERVSAEGSLRLDSWGIEPTHRAPAVRFTVDEAHQEMRRHIECGVDFCPRKRSAQQVLVEAGKLQVDLRVGR